MGEIRGDPMKLFFLLLFSFVVLTACDGTTNVPDGVSGTETDNTDKIPKPEKILVAYFSKTGTTETIAGFIHDKAGGDMFKIETITPYPVDYGATLTIAQQELGQNARPELSGSVSNMDAYDILFLGYPIWHGYEPMAIRSFLDRYDISGKTIVPFCTIGSTGIGSSVTSIRNLASGATVLDGRRFNAGARNDVNAWIQTIGVTEQ
jgi:flavodoxin